MNNFVIAQQNGGNGTAGGSAGSVNNGFVFGKEIPIDMDFTIPDNRTHRSFGSVCVGRNDELYICFRAGYAHGILNVDPSSPLAPYNGIGGDLYWSVSYDYGKSWATPTLFIQAGEDRDLRDVIIWYDDIFDQYFVMYADDDIVYTESRPDGYVIGVENTFHILCGKNIFDNMSDLNISSALPFSGLNQTFCEPFRYGSYTYVGLYGRDGSDISVTFDIAVMRATVGSQGSNWNTVKKWSDHDGLNEITLFSGYDETSKKLRLYALARKGDEGFITYTEDNGSTWSQKTGVGFDCAGGPKVYMIDGTLMLVAREQNAGMNVFAIFSNDNGATWSNRMEIANCGPGYSSLARFKNGRALLFYSKEYTTTGHIYMRELYKMPVLG